MSAGEHYGYGEQPTNPDRAELAERAKKKLQETGSWRDGTTKIFDTDAVFKTVSNSYKKAQQSKTEDIKIPTSLQPISRDEAEKMGLSANAWQQQNITRTIKRQQYYDSKRSL